MTDLAHQIAELSASMFQRRLTHGRTGNLSARVGDGFLITPTGGSLGTVTPGDLALVDLQGRHLDGPRPSKEAFLHAALYRARPDAGAVVHLHSTHAVAVSCHDGLDPDDVLPPLTAYYVMARTAHALLLANHGPIAAGASLAAAADTIEELEETARLWLLLRDRPTRPLTPDQVRSLS
jgi:ribulose-5-phosphate 4-epimerase/fuculose-1-phosphate aldolase